jgi:type IV pilus assembly protein PilB
MKEKEQLGKVLMDMGLLTEEQLEEALNLQEMSGEKRLGEILLKMGVIKEEELAYVLGQQLNLPVFSLKNVEIPKNVLQLIPEKLIKKHMLLPFSLQDNVLTVVMSDPMDIFVIDDIQYQTGYQVQEAIGLKSEISEIIARYFSSSSEELKEAIEDIKKENIEVVEGSNAVNLEQKDSPTVSIVNNVIAEAIRRRASDIHIEPRENILSVRYRLDGVLQENNLQVPVKTQSEIISRIKLLANLDISEKRLPQDGRIKVRTTVQDKSISADLRISTLPIYRGEKICIRILDKSALNLTLTDVGFSDENLKMFQVVSKKPSGIILMTGPTGSGKTSTLYAALNYISSPEINITTVEDPVEYEIPEFNQVNIQTKIGLTFGRALRAILRQDPDVVLIGEIRDEETAGIAIEASLTGRLVFSTLHTNDAPSSVSRLIEMGVEPYLVSSTVRCIVAQRLVRRLCVRCKTKLNIAPDKLEQLGRTYRVEAPKLFRPRGCVACSKTGYKGRVAIHEVLLMNDEIADMINRRASTTEILAVAKKTGFRTLSYDGYVKALNGITTIREVERVALM